MRAIAKLLTWPVNWLIELLLWLVSVVDADANMSQEELGARLESIQRQIDGR